MPNDPLRTKLRGIINDVAEAETSPKFEPHMTIISIPFPSSTPELSGALTPILQKYKNLKLQFKSLFVGSSYFISLVISLQKTPSLSAFQQEVVQCLHSALGIDIPPKEFFPHISLYYGETSTEERDRIASSIRANGVSSDEDGLAVNGAAESLPNEIWVVQTEGSVRDWKVLEIVKLES